MMHTDSNQHVNSLVYPRLFEEAVVERAFDPEARVPGAESLLVRAIDIRYRKPFFAGDRASIALALEGAAATGAFVPAGADRPSCTIAADLR